MRLLTEIEPERRNPKEDERSLDQILHDLDVADAARYQKSAAMNYASAKKYHHSERPSSTALLATIQYAYARWLLGIDDYYLSLPYHLPHRAHRQELAAPWHTPRPGSGGVVRTPTPWHSGPARILPR